jgi:hypothetical protein
MDRRVQLMKVRVFLNDDEGHWFGYRPSHEVREVFGYEDEDRRSDKEACERAFRLFNVDPEDLRNGEVALYPADWPGDDAGKPYPASVQARVLAGRAAGLSLARRYREGRNRSLSVGDVIAIERGRTRTWWVCAMLGWGTISKPKEARDGTGPRWPTARDRPGGRADVRTRGS